MVSGTIQIVTPQMVIFSSHMGHTAAHRTLPFNKKVEVTNPKNNKSVVVRINDRGPFSKGIEIDLTKGSADAIGMSGTQNVLMRVLH